jgi:hypothetical protein
MHLLVPVSFTITGMAAFRPCAPLAMSELPLVRPDLP